MEAVNQESVVAPGDLAEAPISLTTTDTNLTGSWKFFRPNLMQRLPPCRHACPLGNEIPAIMQAVDREELDRALALLRRHNPLPAVTGRVCPNFCQQNCNRGRHDQEVLVGCIERFVGDYGLDRPFPAPRKKREETVLVVGSGPAGLAAAYFLASAGIKVRILERNPEPGGLLRYGIPAYRLPRDILYREIYNLVESLDIDLHLDHPVRSDELLSLLSEADSLVCAPGLWEAARPQNIPDLPQVLTGLDLLQHIGSNLPVSGRSFAVIGGGNVAVDVARSLMRLGKTVHIVYRRTFADMPAYAHEKQQAVQEGITLHEQRLIDRVQAQGEGLLLHLSQAVNQEDSLQSGPKMESMQVDRLVVATGQSPHMQIPTHERIFTSGDLSLGPATVVQAMASGREAAAAILDRIDPGIGDRMFLTEPDLPVLACGQAHLDYVPRQEPILVAEAEQPAASDFQELYPGLSSQEIRQAASRCLQCTTCNGCGICWFFCPDVAISLEDTGDQTRVRIDQEHCKGCGLCAEVCPRGMIEMQEDV